MEKSKAVSDGAIGPSGSPVSKLESRTAADVYASDLS